MNYFNNKYANIIRAIILVILLLYIVLLDSKPKKYIRNLFKNSLFRIFILFIIVLLVEREPRIAILLTIAFVQTLDYINMYDSKKTFKLIKKM
jgi:hypothetical protein